MRAISRANNGSPLRMASVPAVALFLTLCLLLVGCDFPPQFNVAPTPNPPASPTAIIGSPPLQATATTAPSATISATSPNPAALNPTEQAVFDLLNQQRTSAGLQPTALDRSITAIARARSADMATRGYFAHVNPDGKNFLDLLKQQGISYHHAGEIIAEDNYPSTQTVSITVDGWMHSPTHHDIIMTPDYTLVGVGEAVKGDEHIYTAIYLRP